MQFMVTGIMTLLLELSTLSIPRIEWMDQEISKNKSQKSLHGFNLKVTIERIILLSSENWVESD